MFDCQRSASNKLLCSAVTWQACVNLFYHVTCPDYATLTTDRRPNFSCSCMWRVESEKIDRPVGAEYFVDCNYLHFVGEREPTK